MVEINIAKNITLIGKPITYFPTDKGEEARLGSIFMACLTNILEFSEAFAKELPRGTVGSIGKAGLTGYLEVYKSEKEPDPRLDAIVMNGSKWIALFEFKSGKDTLAGEQIKKEINFAQANKISHLITISNEFTPTCERLPYAIDGRKSVTCLHFSWTHIRTIIHNILQAGNLDLLSKSILSDFDNFLSDERSGCKKFTTMPQGWREFVSAVANKSINKNDELLEGMICAWQQEIDDMCLNLERRSPYRGSVKLAKSRFKLSKTERDDMCVKHLFDKQNFNTAIEDKYLSSPIEIIADFKGKSLEFKIHTDAPKDKDKPQQALIWLRNELKNDIRKNKGNDLTALSGLKLFVKWNSITAPTNDSILNFMERNDENLIPQEYKNKKIQTFFISYIIELGKNFSSGNNFILELEKHAEIFYVDVAQYMPKWEAEIKKDKNIDV
ncbi:MAG: hypothetical protein K0U39_07880 [Alphaproteobacteria bacterium]|nr:hypothetical protein [Alphaproteobacteria bacterium]